ncbi:MAG: DeoR/GlpR family DNA-binding transcription regulator [Verrucomicrobiae bacterium]|nr:DeoR/GlpR family DNA-binding transcription regulator [Verrucomicrobiae bacterium]
MKIAPSPFPGRQKALIDLVEDAGACTYAEIAERLGVCVMTVRRNVDQLVRDGRLIKTLGGVQCAHAPADFYESDLASRLSIHRAEKCAIARKALELIKGPETLFLDGSSTCQAFVRVLAESGHKLTVMTNSLLIAREAGRSPHLKVILVGGQLDSESFSCFGETSEEQFKGYYVDKAFFSTKGFIPAEGTFESAVGLFRIKQLVAERAKQVILLADHYKFGQRALCKVLNTSQIHVVVTDSGLSRDERERLKKTRMKVCVAETGNRNAGGSHA